MDVQKERELFLAHMRSIGSARFMFELDEDGNFDDMSMAYAWSSWQAAKAQAVPDLGELQERIAGHQYYHDEHGHMIVDMDDVVKEISGFDSWKAQAVPEGFVEKTESNTHHYFKLKDWNEWSCIDVIKDAITSDYDINSIVEVEQLEVVEIQQSTKYGLLRFAKRHGDEVVFFDSLEEAQQAQESAND